MKSLKEMKQKGRTLRKHLEAVFGREVTLAQAYEALAVSEGFENWNVLSAQLAGTAIPPAAPTTLATTAVEGPRVMAIFMTLDGKAKRAFDATAWFEQASYEEIVELMEEVPSNHPWEFPFAYGGRDHGWALAEFFAGKDKGVDEVYAYVKALSDAGGDCGGSDCYVSGPKLNEWIGSMFNHRGQRIQETKHNRAYGRLMMGLNGDTAVSEPSASKVQVFDTDLWQSKHLPLVYEMCGVIWRDCVERWNGHAEGALPCEYIIESSDIFPVLSQFGITSTGEEGYSDTAEHLMDEFLTTFGYYRQARLIYEGVTQLNEQFNPMPLREAPRVVHPAEKLYNMLQVMEVNLVDVLNEYNVPDECPEWQWVESQQSFAHKNNGGEPGVWEFMVRVNKMDNPDFVESIPETLRPFFESARKQGAAWLMFHQG